MSASNDKELLSPLSHNCSLLSRVFKRSLLFAALLGFCSNNTGIVNIPFKLIDLGGVFCVHRFNSLVTSLMYFFPACSVSNIRSK